MDRHWCNNIIFDCCSLRLKQRRDHTSARELHNLNISSQRVVSKLSFRNGQGKIENATASKQRCFSGGLREQPASARTTSPKRPQEMKRWCVMKGTLRSLAVRVRWGGGATTTSANCVLMYYICTSRLFNISYETLMLSAGAFVTPKGALQPAECNAGATREGP